MTLLVASNKTPASTRRQKATPVEDARKALHDCLETTMGRSLAWHEKPDGIDAPHVAIKITTGTGKSEALRQMLARFIPEAKHRGLPHRILYLVPTHALGDEARLRMPAGVTAALWQGRKATKIGTGEPLCRNLEAVEAALKIGAEVEETACRKGQRGGEPIVCPFYSTCAYQKQKPVAQAADVVFAAHEIGFKIPKAIGDGFGLVVIDEAFWQDGLTDSRLAIGGMDHELQAFPVREGDNVLADETAHLKDLIRLAQKGFSAMPDGYVTRAALIEAGLLPGDDYEPSSSTTACRLEWKRKVDVGLRPDATSERRQKALAQFQFMGQIPRRAAMWQALDELLAGDAEATGRLRIETITTKEGSVRWLRVIGRDDIDETLAKLPLIHADATLPVELVRHYLPRLDLVLDLEVEASHERITQLVGLPVGKSSLQALAPGQRRDGEEGRVSRKRQRLVDAVRHLVRGRRGLVVTYKDIEADFHQVEDVEVAHYNAIEGIDRWGAVDVVVTIGRPLPRPRDIQRMAAAITGKPVVAGGMIEQGRAIRLKSGVDHVLKGRVYEVPEAEMIRQAVTEAAIVQAVGRARGVNRTAGNPVEVFIVLHDTVTELPVDEVVTFTDIEPDAVDEMISRGLVPQWPGDAARLCPDLFPNRNTAKQAYHRARLSVERGTKLVTCSYRELSIRACNQFTVRYRTKGRGSEPRLALVDPAKVPDPRAALEAALGPLVLFEVLPEAASQAAPEKQPVAISEARPPEGPKPPRQPFQMDMFLDVHDIDYAGGLMRPEHVVAVRAAARARGQTQGEVAEVIQLSQAQLCNVLKGRFGLSAAAAERLRGWMRLA